MGLQPDVGRYSMIKRLIAFFILAAGAAYAQTTPNLGLELPNYQAPNWGVSLNYNFSRLDGFLSGGYTLPAFISQGLTLTNLTGGDCVQASSTGLLTSAAGACSTFTLTTTGSGPATLMSGVLNIPQYIPTGTTNQLLYYAASGTAVEPLTLGMNLSIANGTLNATGGTVSGQANGVIPLATGSTTIEAQSHLSDNGTQITATEPFSGTSASFSGAVSAAETNTVYNAASCGYSSPPSWCTGSDIGAWVNAAITAGASTVFIPSGSYTFSTPISITVTNANSNLQLMCANKGVTLNYTGSSEALLIDDAGGLTGMNMGIENCRFNGSGAQASTDGIELITTSAISLSHVSVTSFPGDGIYMQGALESSLFDVRVGSSGAYNLHLAPDTTTGISTNAMHMFGGSLYYGGLANFWDAGNGTYEDQNNTLSGVTEEMTTWTPQNIVEDTANDAIQDGYIEYINVTGTQSAPLYSTLVGNFSGSGIGTSSNNTATSFTFSNNICGTQTAQSGQSTYEVYAANTKFLKVSGTTDFGGPTYGLGFYASGSNVLPSTSQLAIAWKTSMYANPPATGMLYQTGGQPLVNGEFANGDTIVPSLANLDVANGVYVQGSNATVQGDTLQLTTSGTTSYLNAFGTSSTYGNFSLKQYLSNGTGVVTLASDASGDWTAHGYIAATGFTGTQSVTFTPSSGWGTGATASCVSGYHCDQLSGMVEVVAGTGATASPAPMLTITWAAALPYPATCTVSNVYWAGSILAGPQFVQGTTTSAEIAFAGITTAPSSGAESFVTYTCSD